MKKFFQLTSLLLAMLVFAGIVYVKKSTTVPDQGLFHVAGMHGKVSVYRDKFGVPHINAEQNDLDAYFALGFVHAQDRFWQMEFQRRVASGTLSEVFGKKTLTMDEYLRTWGFYQAAQSAWLSYDKTTQEVIESYTAGVNAFIKLGQFPLEVKILHYQPRPWTVIDSICWQKMMAWDLQSHSWLNKIDYATAIKNFGDAALSKYYPDYPRNAPLIIPDKALQINTVQASHGFKIPTPLLTSIAQLENRIKQELNSSNMPGKGSNSWVISGKMTATGKPLLANDVHLSLSAPTLWYLVEMHGPHLHVTGATIPGLPGVIIGHNDNVAWGVTSGYNDAAELYVLSSQDKIVTHNEVIAVRGEPSINFPVSNSEFGPVISDVTPQLKAIPEKIAIKWVALLPGDTTVQSFYKLDYASNWQEFQAALKDFVTPTQNFMYADTQGNIAYYYPGSLPIRHWQSVTPVATTSNFVWDGYIPFEKLPHDFNPAAGYIASANNKVVAADYPYEINARWPVPPFRIQRIVDLIQQKKPLSVDSMIDMQGDTRSEFWLELRPYLLRVKPQDKLSQTAYDILSSWSGNMDKSNPAPTIFAYWLNALKELMPPVLQHADKTIEPLFLSNQLLEGAVSQEFLQRTLQTATQQMVTDMGKAPDDWQWGNIHEAVFNNATLGKSKLLGWIWNRSIASPGGMYTIDVGNYDPTTFKQKIGATFREIIDFNNLDDSLYIIPMGQSDNPFSPHYKDLLRKWRSVGYIKIKSQPACQASMKDCMVLSS